MAQNFTVNYDINVLSQDAVTAINSFTQATKKLDQAMRPFRKLNTSISNLQNNLTKLNAKTYTVKLETSKAVNNVDKLIGRLRRLKAEAKGAGINLGSINTAGGVAAGGTTRNTSTHSGNATSTRNKTTVASRNIVTRNMPKNLGYKLLGPTPLDTGGIMAVDMLKGMGIAYGIAGLGSLISNSVKDYTEYNNIMKTAENILGAHDKRADFKERFAAMERQVRNVGVQTKFTAPQVADASKFLAMAGFDVDAINKSIAPIADIALVGDTDLGETADVVTNIMTGYNISPEKVRKAADIMTMTFTKSNTTLMEIAEAYKYSASLLSAGDVPFEEATAAMGILGNAGIKGSQAGTTMRTIMANIVNPTKKQAAAWKRIGVSRTDKNGNMRDVVDIFEDLNKKDLSLSDYYQIFHKTAAQGAVSLANDVKGWNDIIKENLMSDGLAKELADEKKNTIQGLWAQLTSMFTENGIQAFDEIQQPIKDFLNNIINWLKTSDARNFIRETAKDMLDFAQMIVKITKDILAFYNTFRPVIKSFVELQMKMWPLLGVVRIGKAFLLAGIGVWKFASSIGLLATNIKMLNLKRSGFIGGMSQILGGGAGIGEMTYIGNNKVAVGNLGRTTTKAAADRYNAIYGKRNVSSLANTTSSLLGGALGGYAGYKIGDNISGGDPVVGMLGSIVGAGVGSVGASIVAPWVMNTVLPFLASGPVGWAVGIGAALAAGGAYFLKYKSDVEDAIEANQQYLSSIASINGMSLSEHATTTDKYLNIVYSKQMDVNQAIGEHINLMREQLGIMDEATKKYSDKTLGETHGEAVGNAAKPFKWNIFRSTEDMKKAATSSLILPDGSVDYQGSPSSQEYLDRNGRAYAQWSFNGRLFPETDNGYQRLAAARFLYGLGRDTSEGTSLQKARDSYNKRALASESLADFNAVIKDTQNARIKTYLTRTKEWTMQDLEGKPESEWRRSYDYVNSYNTTLKNMFDIANPLASANAQMLSDFKEILSKLDTGNISEDLLGKFLLHSGIPIFDEVKFGKFASDEFMKQFGWYNNKWNAGTYQFFNVETGKMETINVTAEEARNAFLLFHQQIIDLTNKLNPKVRSYFNTFLDNPIWGYGGTENGSNGKATVDGGVEYDWDSKDQRWKLSPKSKKVSVITEYSNEDMQKKLKQQKEGTGRNGRGGNGSITPATHNTKGASQADYKQHYNNKTAAPKQVIVKIENLMNVKSIDLSKKDNREVIDNVKQQLTQALVDVVHDFDETWHG